MRINYAVNKEKSMSYLIFLDLGCCWAVWHEGKMRQSESEITAKVWYISLCKVYYTSLLN